MKGEKSDYEIIKDKMIIIKHDLNYTNSKEPIKLTKNILKPKIRPRPHSNYIPKNRKNILEKTNQINNFNLLAIGYEDKNRENINEKYLEISKILSMKDKETNTKITYFNNKTSNEINLLNEFNFPCVSSINNQSHNYINNQMNQEYLSTSPLKRVKSNLLINKSIIPKNFFGNKINRYLSPKLYVKSKYSKNKKILSNEKTSNRCASPSTTNNSNLNANTHNNSHSSQFVFRNSLKNSNFQRNLKLNLNIENSNNIQNINGDIIPEFKKDNNKKVTAIEYQINQLLTKKEKQKKGNYNKENKKVKKNKSFNVEQMYLNYAKKIEKINQKESNAQNKSSGNKKDNKSNTSLNIQYIKRNLFNNSNSNRNINKNKIKNNFYRNNDLNFRIFLSDNIEKKESKNKYCNPKIKYSFLDKAINDISR